MTDFDHRNGVGNKFGWFLLMTGGEVTMTRMTMTRLFGLAGGLLMGPGVQLQTAQLLHTLAQTVDHKIIFKSKT